MCSPPVRGTGGEKVEPLSFYFFHILLGKGLDFLCEYFCHWREKNQLHLSPNLDLDWDENELQTLVADLPNVTQATVTSRIVLVSYCQEMHCVDSYI